jgi:antitoxin CcdA
MTAAKRKVSVSLDADLVEELETVDVALSTRVNDALERRRRQHLLGELLAELDRRHGPVPEKLIAKYETLLS